MDRLSYSQGSYCPSVYSTSQHSQNSISDNSPASYSHQLSRMLSSSRSVFGDLKQQKERTSFLRSSSIANRTRGLVNPVGVNNEISSHMESVIVQLSSQVRDLGEKVKACSVSPIKRRMSAIERSISEVSSSSSQTTQENLDKRDKEMEARILAIQKIVENVQDLIRQEIPEMLSIFAKDLSAVIQQECKEFVKEHQNAVQKKQVKEQQRQKAGEKKVEDNIEALPRAALIPEQKARAFKISGPKKHSKKRSIGQKPIPLRPPSRRVRSDQQWRIDLALALEASEHETQTQEVSSGLTSPEPSQDQTDEDSSCDDLFGADLEDNSWLG